MKQLLFIFTLLVGLLLPAAAQSPNRLVYISTGHFAQRYHTNINCGGLAQCKAEGHMRTVTLNDALSMGRTHCQRTECNR